MEGAGERVRSLCSADGEAWFSVGEVGFCLDDPLKVGLHVIGNTIRTIHRDANPDGTVIRSARYFGRGILGCLSPSESGREFCCGEDLNSSIYAKVEKVVISRYDHLSAGHRCAFHELVIVGIIGNELEFSRDFYPMRSAA